MASNYMVKVYADLIRKGKKTIEEVPDPLQAAVREILENSKNGAEGFSELFDDVLRVFAVVTLNPSIGKDFNVSGALVAHVNQQRLR